MSAGSWAEAGEIFADLLELPPDARVAELGRRTLGDPELREAVEGLLAAHEAAGEDFLNSVDPALVAGLAAEAEAPERVGAYRLVREVGRGGMGTVHLAERADGQFEHRVAVKMLKLGMDSEAILTRFLQERQILASLDHPNIGRLIDGGLAEGGRPYIVMEYVDGLDITDYADERGLSSNERIRLFLPVCDALAFAHRNLVVHRDLKPSNIQVTRDGQPKLLDFGIAKILSGSGEEGADVTEVGPRPLTPGYAAPEQCEGRPVTTSTDVYALGVVLAELLGGRRPDSATDTATLSRELPGDLGTVVAKALRSEPDQRYASAEALGDDLRRYLARRPIRARPATAGYRFSRFVRRHPTGVTAAASGAVVVLGLAIVSSIQASRIAQQADELAAERDRARTEAATSREVADFLVGVFEVSDPLAAGAGEAVSARSLLDAGAARIADDLETDPAVRARLLDVMARAYANLGSREQGEDLALAALAARGEAFGPDDPRVAASWRLLGSLRRRADDLDGAEAALREALARLDARPEGDPALFATRAELSGVLHIRGEHEAARAMIDTLGRQMPAFLATLEDGGIGGGEVPREVLTELGTAMLFAGDYDGASGVFETLAAAESARDGPGAPGRGLALWSQARAERARGRAAVADSLFRTTLEIREARDGVDPVTAEILTDYGALLQDQNRPEEADSILRRALAIHEATVGPDHPFAGAVWMSLGRLGLSRERFGDAARSFGRAAEIYRGDATGESSALLPVALWRTGVSLGLADRFDEGLPLLEEAVTSFRDTYGDAYLMTVNSRYDLGSILVRAGRGAEAVPVMQAALDAGIGRFGPTSPRVDGMRVVLAEALAQSGRGGAARELLQPVLERLEADEEAPEEMVQRVRRVLDQVGSGPA